MNQFSHPIAPIQSAGWILFTLFLLPSCLQAQLKPRFPTIDVTTNVMSWTQQTGSLAAQVSTFKWLGLRAGVAYSPQQGQSGNFLTQSKALEFLGEARLFPFGSPHTLYKRDKRPTFWKKPKMGCSGRTCLGEIPSNGLKKLLKGLFVAPGFSYSRQDEVFIPKAGQNALAPVEGYENHFVRKAPLLTTGYQIRIRNLTLSAGYMLKGSMDKSSFSSGSQNRNTGESETNTMFPWNVQVDRKWCLEVGVNF